MALGLSAGTPAYADVMYSGRAYGASAPSFGVLVADTGPLPPEGGSLMNGAAGFDFLNGAVTSGAISTMTMGAGGVASSNANLLNFNTNLTSVGIPLLVHIDSITAASSADGNSMPPVVMGATTLTGAMGTFNGVPLNIPMNPPPNTVIDLGGGNTITLNEQMSMVTNDHGEISVTALHGHILGVDVFIAHAESDVTPSPVPEPGTVTLAGVGLFGLACFTFRRRNGSPRREGAS
jgi:hypothetical protein